MDASHEIQYQVIDVCPITLLTKSLSHLEVGVIERVGSHINIFSGQDKYGICAEFQIMIVFITDCKIHGFYYFWQIF